jgi:hypothetical protein
MPGVTTVARAQQESSRSVRLNVLMSNPTAKELRNQRLWMYLPVRTGTHVRALHQQCTGDHVFSSDPLGHNVIELKLDSLPPYGHHIFSIVVQLQLGYAPTPEGFAGTAAWVAPQLNIESDHPSLRELGASLVRQSAHDTALEAYRWVVLHMTYSGYRSDDRGALHALQTLTGDCTEYAALLVALCRAAGVPSRMVGGYVSDRSIAPRPADYHDWAEIWIDRRWRVADAQLRHWLAAETRYIPLRYYWDKPINPVGLSHRYRVAGEVQVNL